MDGRLEKSVTLLGGLVAIGFLLWLRPSPSQIEHFEGEEEVVKPGKAVRLRASFEQEFQATMDPALGRVPTERLPEAYRTLKKLENESGRAIPGLNWKERGPDNFAGRIRAMMVDPNDPTGETFWAGSVSGGLWKTTNISSSTPNWQSVDEFFNNLAITSIAYDPTSTSTFYFSTGEGFGNQDAVRGLGIWKSTDGGTTWSQLSSTNGTTFHWIQKIVVTSTGTLLACTQNGGVQRSTNGGNSWTKVLGNGMSGASSDFAYDIEFTSAGAVFASVEGSIHKSTNDGASFGSPMSLPLTADRVELSSAPSDGNVLYGIVERNGSVEGLIGSTNGGGNWSALVEPQDTTNLVDDYDFANGQAWYDLAIAVDPTDANTFLVGGINLFKTTDGGNTWAQMSSWYPVYNLQVIHADQHDILFDSGNPSRIFFSNDGGIYQSNNGNDSVPSLEARTKGLNVTQFYSAEMSPTAYSSYLLGGTQDNGTLRQNAPGISAATQPLSGDGGFHHIDEDTPDFQIASYIYNQYRRTSDGGVNWSVINSGTTGSFINPTDYDDNANILYAAHNNQSYLRWNNPQTGNSFSSVSINQFGSTGKVTAVSVAPFTANRVFFGLSNGRVVRVNNANSGSPNGNRINNGSGMPAGTISCIAIDPSNEDHMLVTYSNYGVTSVWETPNAGGSWFDVEGNLPDMPVRWAVFDPNNPNQALLATELGVWATTGLNGGSTVWSPANTGFANVRTNQLKVRKSDNLVLAASHGRGLFTSDVFTTARADFLVDETLTYLGRPVRFLDNSYQASSWLWDFGDGSFSTQQNPTHFYTNPGRFTIRLTINGALAKVLPNYVHVLPNEGTPYFAADGGNFEVNTDDFGSASIEGSLNLWERGVPSFNLTTVSSPANAWKTDLDGPITKESYKCALHTPNYNLTNPGTYTLQFKMSMEYQGCNGPYGAQMQYTTDKGVTWQRLGNYADPLGQNWYNRGPSTFPCIFNSSVFPDQVGWTTFATDSLTTYDISFLAGNPDVAFRFVFAVSGIFGTGYSFDGFMVDDFEIIGTANGSNNTIPVEMSGLRAEWQDRDAHLNWETFTEENNLGFEVEREQDGAFTSIGFVPGAGNSQQNLSYQFVDPDPKGEIFRYRLKQVNQNGEASYSNVVELFRDASDRLALEGIGPMPFRESLNIYFNRQPAGNISLSLLSLSGRKVLEQNLLSSSENVEVSGANGLAEGVYFLVLKAENQTWVEKVLKTK